MILDKKTILVIDDEVTTLLSIKHILEKQGCIVYTANNGVEAQNILKKHLPDIIITDLLMPEMDGIEIIRDVRRNFGDIKIIAISAGGRIAADKHLKFGKLLGANRVLQKPFSPAELINEIGFL